MWKQLLIPMLAVGALAFAVTHVVRSQQLSPPKQPLVEPARSPYVRTVAGTGVVEARSDASNTANSAIGSELSGVVARVHARVGRRVAAGEPLFELDDRQRRAELGVREANLTAARAQLQRLDEMPRSEEVPPSEARLREAQANVDLQADLLRRAERLTASSSVSEEEVFTRRQTHAAAIAQLAQAEANLMLLKAGAWEADKAVARAAVAQAEAQLGQTRSDLGRLVVRAPLDATVLQVNLRLGEFVGTPANQPLVVLGDIDQLHVRVDIDENDIHRFRPGTAATAILRGDPRQTFLLRFVRVEPFVIPKKALTGDNTERVDTRVLQVIYALKATDARLYVGQQLDVFLEGES